MSHFKYRRIRRDNKKAPNPQKQTRCYVIDYTLIFSQSWVLPVTIYIKQ